MTHVARCYEMDPWAHGIMLSACSMHLRHHTAAQALLKASKGADTALHMSMYLYAGSRGSFIP